MWLYIFTLFAPSDATNQPESTVGLCYMGPRGLLGPSAVTLTKYLKYEKENFYSDVYNILNWDLINDVDPIRILGYWTLSSLENCVYVF